MLFCPFPKNLDGGLLDDYTLGLRSFFKSGKITEKIPKYRYYRYFFWYIDIGFFQYRNSLQKNIFKILLSRYTNMAAMTSHANALYIAQVCKEDLTSSCI